MMDDAELLRRYIEDRSEDAFTELVHRHLRLVYSTALRRVGHDAHLAEDVAQKVFADLARKAPSLRGRTTLGGWLYVSTHAASAAVVRSERRRKTRETEAQTMHSLHSPSAPETDWDRLRPVLDEAIVDLRDDEREAVVLRFFEKRTFAEVGAALRLSEEAARKRVDRALEKMRTALERNGVTSTTGALALALAAIAPHAIPAGLATKVAGHALGQSAAAGGSSLAAMLGSGVLVGLGLVGGTFAIISQHRANDQLEAELAQLQASQHLLAERQTENHRLARQAAEVADLRRAAAELPAMRAALAPTVSPSALPAPVPTTVTVEANGMLRWGSELVNLGEFIARLTALKENAPGGETKIVIRGLSEFPALAWAIDEVRKSGIKHVVVESHTAPDPKIGLSWF